MIHLGQQFALKIILKWKINATGLIVIAGRIFYFEQNEICCRATKQNEIGKIARQIWVSPCPWSSLVVEDDGYIGPSGKLLRLCQTPKIMHGIIPYMFDSWADPLVHLLLLKNSMAYQYLPSIPKSPICYPFVLLSPLTILVAAEDNRTIFLLGKCPQPSGIICTLRPVAPVSISTHLLCTLLFHYLIVTKFVTKERKLEINNKMDGSIVTR